MSRPSAVTVAVLCRADEPALARTLASLEAAAGRLTGAGREVRFVVCVNGPSGTSALEAARAFAARAEQRVLILVDARADKARAWNLVRGTVTTPALVFCDADVDVAEGALERLVGTLELEPTVALASARQVPVWDDRTAPASRDRLPPLHGAPLVARAAALPYRFDFQVVGGRLYAMRTSAVEAMPEGLLLEDGWLSAELGNDALRTVHDAEVYFRPASTVADYYRERLRTEAGKIQIREQRRAARREPTAIARYPWRAMRRGLGVRDLPLLAVNVAVRLYARTVAQLATSRGRRVAWAPIASSKFANPHATGGPTA